MSLEALKFQSAVSTADDRTTFEWALRAHIPLITVTTPDPAHFVNVVKFLFPKRHLGRLSSRDIPAGRTDDEDGFDEAEAGKLDLVPAGIYWRLLAPPWTANRSRASEWAFGHFIKKQASLVVVNPHPQAEIGPMWFDAGPLPTPWPLVAALLKSYELSQEKIAEVEPVLGGLTLKEVAWLTALTQTKHHVVDRIRLAQARRSHFPERAGLAPVDTDLGFYIEESTLEDWLTVEAKFLTSDDDRLRPRGILLDGQPGVGKSMFAKRIASKLQLPLYRMEMAGLKDKYVGVSERNLRHLLMSLNQVAPCVFLADEIEKLFSTTEHHDSGVTTGLLASWLWWLQEHKSPVLTVMTTNKKEIIPPELYRPGRVDRVVHLKGVPFESIGMFVSECCKSYSADHLISKVCADVEAIDTRAKFISQAHIVETVRQAVKRDLIAQGKV